MKRRQDWPERLAAYLDARRYMPFSWRENDCTSFAAGAVEAITGQMPPLPAYAHAGEAARLLMEQPLRERVGALYGAEIPVSFAQRGDLVLMELDERETLGVWDGQYIAGPAADGMLLAPRSAAVCAWRV
jgi:hypothetical protein